MTEEADETHKEGRQFLPNHLVEEVGVIFLVTGVILVLASLLRPEEAHLPHVFFAGALEMIATVAPWFLTMVLTILVVFLFVLPLLDRSEERHPMKRKIFVLIILAVIVMWIAFTVLGF
jgi:quinol-cytochrome oxidoreductase complex cytochrome b subunit